MSMIVWRLEVQLFFFGCAEISWNNYLNQKRASSLHHLYGIFLHHHQNNNNNNIQKTLLMPKILHSCFVTFFQLIKKHM